MDGLVTLFLIAQLLKLIGAAILVLLAVPLYKEVRARRRRRATRPFLRLSLPEIEALYPQDSERCALPSRGRSAASIAGSSAVPSRRSVVGVELAPPALDPATPHPPHQVGR